jgi:chromosome segregation protein
LKIKKLEMIGFKSFVDRTIVNFDHEVLGIVGPNGCGKSNIVDAIRWCMGEQSAKHLRGRSMEDVIFSGSESRAGHDFAEVTLTFENDARAVGDVPIEYRDYPEIAVTRRLHRNGDSDYLINKTQVRLKDITDLFLGTGVGTKAYSIIEQGKIGLIVSAKPEDRRLLIEEAAGITKYKSKKKQAERKMELTQQNLLRVGDIVTEIERNLGSLKRQAAKAERYLSYRNELEDLQLWDASSRYLEIVGWTKLEASEVERFTLEFDAARTNLVAREAELEGVRLEAHAAEERLDVAQNESFTAENEVRAEEAAIARAMDKIVALQAREAQAQGESDEIEEQRARLEHERETVASEVRTFESDEEIHGTSVAAEESRLEGLSEEHRTAEARVAELRHASSKARADIASAEAQLSGFERRRAEMQTRLDKLRNEREDLEGTRIEMHARAHELAQEVTDLRTGKVTSTEEKEALEARLLELRTAITGSERALEEAKSELSKKRSRLHALLEVQARLEGVGTGVKALIGTKDETICGLVADRIEAPHELTAAVAGLLGSRLQDVVVCDLDRGIELLEGLAQGKRGRATILPLHPRYVAGAHAVLPSFTKDGLTKDGLTQDGLAKDGLVVERLVDRIRYAAEDESLVHALLGDAVVVADLETALRVREAHGDALQGPIVTLSGTVLFPDGRVAGGTGEDVAAGMLDGKRETRELAVEVAQLDVIASERLARHQELRGSIAEVQGALDRARHQAHKDELALVTAEKDHRALEGQLQQAMRRIEVLAEETTDLATSLVEAAGERNEAQQVLDDARALLDEVTAKLGEHEALAASWRAEVDVARQIVTEKKVHWAGAKEKLTAARGTLQRLERSTQELTERRRRLEDEMISGARALGESAALAMAHKEKLVSALDRARDAGERLAATRTDYDGFRTALGEREAALKDLRQASESAKESLTQHEMALREQALAMQHLLAGVAEKFRGLHLPRVVGDYHMRPPPDEDTKSRIGELGHLIERMGSVNLDAMREHEESEKRYEFYSTQKADLEKALDDLERAIAQMNKESKRLFADTFAAVNLKFQEIFPKMFRGGRASLRLTNPDDMLETGIDILAQPPGKKLSSIELMSGGEKALTAVSLIFAIFQIKPSPFCILDEVDAPLDEANVARYNDMIRSMTHQSQFILITHIKRTMQLVDVLYGVTMQEPGVSRLVSVKMNDAAEKKRPALASEAAAVA